jgi:DinB superfamily/Glutaredoxin
MTTTDVQVTDQVLEIFWMPGCSSCLRMKEFVERMGMPHVAVNVAAQPEQAARLSALGLGVPAAVLGDAGVPGVDLVGIAQLMGYDYDPPAALTPAELKDRYDEVMTVALGLVEQMTPEALDYKSPDRDRSLRYLVLHLSTIMRGFVIVEDTNFFTDGYEFIADELTETGTKEELLVAAAETRRQLDEWWAHVGYDDPFDRVLESAETGHWSLHEAFERAVWHTTQHTRQLQYFLVERLGITPGVTLGASLLAGLPLPEGIHA